MDLLPEVERLTHEVHFRRGAMNRAISGIQAAKRLLWADVDGPVIDLLNRALADLNQDVPPLPRASATAAAAECGS